MKLTPRPSQEEAIVDILSHVGGSNGYLLGDEPGAGKAQPLDALVLTPQGFMKMGEISVGQEVVSPDGTTALVSGVFPQGVRPIYRVTLADGRSVEADEDHLWSVWSHNAKKRGGSPVQKTTRELLENLVNGKDNNANWYIETCEPVDLGGEWRSAIDPYLLGLLLGDGSMVHNTIMISSADEEILDSVRELVPDGVELKFGSVYDYRFTYAASRGRYAKETNPIRYELARLWLHGLTSHQKFVPRELLNSSKADRLALLQGLLDTDGGNSRGGFDFTCASEQLRDAVAWLTRSLGGRAAVTYKHLNTGPYAGNVYYRVYGRLPAELSPFRLARKIEKVVKPGKPMLRWLAVKSIEYVGQKEAQCIMVDSELHEYVTDNFIRTHNTLLISEVVLRAMKLHNWSRVLIVALPDTHKQWVNTFLGQSDGAVEPFVMDGSKQGRLNYEAFMSHKPGIFIAGSHYLVEKDWSRQLMLDDAGKPIPELDAKTGLRKFKPRKPGTIGPAEEPIFKTKPLRKLVFYKKFARKKLDAVMFDEIQVASSKKSHARTTLGSMKANFRVGFSGSWFMNKLENMWTVAKWVWPGTDPVTDEFYVINDHKTWKETYLKQEPVYGANGRVQTTARGNAVMRTTGEKEPGAFVKTLPGYRRLEMDDRPPEAIVVKVEPTPEQKAQMQDLERDLMTWVLGWDGEETPLVVDLPMTLRMRLRQVAIAALSVTVDPETGDEKVYFADDAASAKLTALRGIVDYWGDQPVGILTDSKIGADLTVRRMTAAGYSARAWTGDLSRPEREKLKQAFMAGEFQYLVGTIQSMGTGIDGLQKVCSKVIWLSEADGNPALNDQALKRYFRPGRTTQNGDFQSVKLVLAGSVDEITLEQLLDRAWRVRAAMNGGVKV